MQIKSTEAALSIFLVIVTLIHCGCDNRSGARAVEYEQYRKLVFNGKFAEASTNMEGFLKRNPDHALASHASFMIAKCKLGIGDPAGARTWFDLTIQRYPKTEEASKSRFKLAVIEFFEGNEQEARRRFSELAQDADGPYTPEATEWVRFLDDQEKKLKQ